MTLRLTQPEAPPMDRKELALYRLDRIAREHLPAAAIEAMNETLVEGLHIGLPDPPRLTHPDRPA